jgi:hypothetical protein
MDTSPLVDDEGHFLQRPLEDDAAPTWELAEGSRLQVINSHPAFMAHEREQAG